MATSLAEQLKRLAIPKTVQAVDSKKRASLLFDPKEAANLDRDDVYDIGVSGLEELIKIDNHFEEFTTSLFAVSSRFMERSVETQENNKELNKKIDTFLMLLSPYLLLEATHRALEWLICRFKIHEWNVDKLLALILPYHETKIFVRILQLVNLRANCNSHLAWLAPIQKKGFHLPKNVLVTHAVADSSFLRFICDSTVHNIKLHKEYGIESKLGTVLTFYGMTLMSVLARQSVSTHLLTVMLDSLLEALSSSLADFKAAGYIVAGQLLATNQLTQTLTTNLLYILINDKHTKLQKERLMLLVLLYQTQEDPPPLPAAVVPQLNQMTSVLDKIAREHVLVGPLLLQLVMLCLDQVFSSNSDHTEGQVMCWGLATNVECDARHVGHIIRLMNRKHIEAKKMLEENTLHDSHIVTWLADLIYAVIEKHSDVLAMEKKDAELQVLLKKWRGAALQSAEDVAIAKLVKKCSGEHYESVWRKLRPLLLTRISDDHMLEILLKVAPSYDNVVFLVCLERLLRHSKSKSDYEANVSKKILTSNFVTDNPCLSRIAKQYTGAKKSDSIAEVIERTLLRDGDSAVEFEPCLLALQELKTLNVMGDCHKFWVFGFEVLVAALPTSNWDATCAVQILRLYRALKKLKRSYREKILTAVMEYVSKQRHCGTWYDLADSQATTWARIWILEALLLDLGEDNKKKQNEALRNTFFRTCFSDQREVVRFLSAICGGVAFPFPTSASADLQVSRVFQLHALHLVWKQLSKRDELIYDCYQSELMQTTCFLLLALSNPSAAVRKAALMVLNELNVMMSYACSAGRQSFLVFLSQLLHWSLEITMDAAQVNVALFCTLSPSHSVQAVLRGEVRDDLSVMRALLLAGVTSEDIPLHVATRLLQLLESVNSVEVLTEVIKVGERAVRSDANRHVTKKAVEEVWARLNGTTAGVLDTAQGWLFAVQCLQASRDDLQGYAVAMLKSVDKEVFEAISEERRRQLVSLMMAARTDTESLLVSSAVVSAMKKILLDAQLVRPLITAMVQAPARWDRNLTSIVETAEWRRGICLLELIQSKKKLRNTEILLDALFAVLKLCVDQEEQVAFEYGKQLVLGFMLHCCRLAVDSEAAVDDSVLNVELVAQCLRVSSNPQTHHHALLLLSLLASIIPMQVMHNTMAIFTFMGSSVARLDDEHSVNVVTQVVDTIVPILVQHLSTEAENSECVVAEVLRVFVWALTDIPEHRRQPLFQHLVTTLDPDRSLAILLLLLCESHVQKGEVVSRSKDSSVLPSSLRLGIHLSLSLPPITVLNNLLTIINYLVALPLLRMNPEKRPGQHRAIRIESSRGLFDVEKSTPKELRHFGYTILTLLNSLLGDNQFTSQVSEMKKEESDAMEVVYKETISSLLQYVPLITRQMEIHQSKYWRVVIHQTSDLLDKYVSLVSSTMLVGVMGKLLSHGVGPLRRKALDMLNVHLQNHHQHLAADEKQSLKGLLTPLMELLRSDSGGADGEMVAQTALYSLKLLAKVLAHENTEEFKEVTGPMAALVQVRIQACIEFVTGWPCTIASGVDQFLILSQAFSEVLREILVELGTKSRKCKGHMQAAMVLTVAELVTCLKVHAVSELTTFFRPMLKPWTKYTNADSCDLGLTSLSAAINRVVEVLPLFLSPYLDELLSTASVLSVKWPDQAELNKRLAQIRQKLSSTVPARVLVPSIARCYHALLEMQQYQAVGYLLGTLTDCINSCPDASKILPELTPFYLTALQFRSNADDSDYVIDEDDVDAVEAAVVDNIVALVLKLSESSFKPLYYQIFHLCLEHKDGSITFYRLSYKLAENLKGLFVMFAGHFLQNAATLLDATNTTKAESHFSVPGKSLLLLKYILKTLHMVFLFDSTESNFLNKDKFEVLLHPLVDQLENQLGGLEELERRTRDLLIPCLAQMALATDDTLWKSLNYQVLQKSRSSLPQVRIAAVESVVGLASKLGENYMLLLPETIGTLAELLEDDDERVENSIKSAIQRMEQVLNQPIREYFQS